MAIDTIPPWVRGVDTVGELSAGAGEGLAAAGLEQRGRFESERLGLEAQRMRQSAALAQAQLAQAAEEHQMEFQARQKLAEQNQERLKQQLNIQNAYKTAALGIAKGRLEETQRAANEKAKAAALTFQREQAFARDVASGVPVVEAYRRNPVSPALLGAAERTITKEDQNKPVIREGRFPIVRIDPKTGEAKVVYTPKTTSTDDIMGAANPAVQPPAKPGLLQRIFGGSSKPPEAPAPSKFGHPKVGDVRAGYRFKGGDPNVSENWEIVKEGE